MDYPPPDPAQTGKKQAILFGVIIVLALLTVLIIYLYKYKESGGGGGKPANPCSSPKMPRLAAGLDCARGGGGGFAWLTSTTPTVSGPAAPTNLTQLKQYKATDSDCVTESACQGFCLNSNECSFYSYDASAQASSKACPATNSVCTLYSGVLPAAINAETTTGYISAGIPTRQLQA